MHQPGDANPGGSLKGAADPLGNTPGGVQTNRATSGNDWYFGSEADRKSIRGTDFPTNAHIGVDSHNGFVHSLQTTTAWVHDSQVWDEPMHGKATSVRAGLPLVRRRQRCPDRWRSRWQLQATMATVT